MLEDDGSFASLALAHKLQRQHIAGLVYASSAAGDQETTNCVQNEAQLKAEHVLWAERYANHSDENDHEAG